MKIENAVSTMARTVTDFRTGESCTALVMDSPIVGGGTAVDFSRECLQGHIPELVKVLAELMEGGRIQPQYAPRALRVIDDKPGLFQHLEVLGDGWAGNAEALRDSRHGHGGAGSRVRMRRRVGSPRALSWASWLVITYGKLALTNQRVKGETLTGRAWPARLAGARLA